MHRLLLSGVLVALCNLGCDGQIVPTSFGGDVLPAVDAEPDSGVRDMGPLDRGVVDRTDAIVDAGFPDAEPDETGPRDVDPPDMGVDPSFSVGGSVAGLEGTGLVLENAGERLPIMADGTFSFTTTVADGSAYDVQVAEHPTEPAQHCSVVDGAGQVAGMDVTDIEVRCARIAFYPLSGAGWNDWVDDDGAGRLFASDSACDASRGGLGCRDCLHGGEMRVFFVPQVRRCNTATAEDALGVFEWVCDENAGNPRFVSVGFRPGRSLGDLIEGDPAAWRPNSLTVQVGGQDVFTSPMQVWWDSPVVTANNGVRVGDADEGTVYAVTQDTAARFVIDASKVSIVITRGSTLSASVSGSVVFASGVDFFWLEGSIDAGNQNLGIEWRNVTCGVLHDVEIQNAGLRAIQITDGSGSGRLSNILLHDNVGLGLEISGQQDARLREFELRDVRAIRNESGGFRLTSVELSTAEGLSAIDSNAHAFIIDDGRQLDLRDIVADRTQGSGLRVTRSQNLGLTDVRVAASSATGVDILESSSNLTLQDVIVANSLQDGLRFRGSGHRAALVRTFSNTDHGVHLEGCTNCVLARVISSNNDVGIKADRSGGLFGHILTANNNVAVGMWNVASNNLTLATGVSAGNQRIGLLLEGDAMQVAVADYAGVENGSWGVVLTTTVAFTGRLKLGENTGPSGNPNCRVVAPAGGLDAANCTAAGPSDALFSPVADGNNAFVAKVVTNDANNRSDMLGARAFTMVRDWLRFETPERIWGLDAAQDWPSSTLAGPCRSGATCRIYDWSLVAENTSLRDDLAPPSGDDVLVHTWAVEPPPNVQADCDAAAPGSILGNGGCQTIVLRHAFEVFGDGVGNDNSLCESGERCVFTPNFGAYQGHGNRQNLAAPGNGRVTGVQMRGYVTNGR